MGGPQMNRWEGMLSLESSWGKARQARGACDGLGDKSGVSLSHQWLCFTQRFSNLPSICTSL